ncbi:MAG: helix-turn-helix transcriptional regulator [Bacteroidota bacterium]
MMDTEQIFILAGGSLGLFFALLLLTAQKYRSPANQYLAWALIILVVVLLKVSAVVEYFFLSELFEFFRIEYLLPVFLYLYVCAALKEAVPQKTILSLLGPFLFFSTVHTLLSVADWLDYHRIGEYLEVVEPFELVVMAIFLCFVVALYTLKVKRSNARFGFKKWIYFNSSMLVLLMLSWLIIDVVEIVLGWDYWAFLWMGVAVFLIGLTYFGVQQLTLEEERSNIKAIYGKKKNPVLKSRRQPSTLHFERIQQLMKEEEIFRDPHLNRERLAATLGLSPGTITRVLKEDGGVNFNEFVDSYRIQLAKRMLEDERFHVFSLEAIGREVGFRSRSTFYATFKKQTGLTPGAYKNK